MRTLLLQVEDSSFYPGRLTLRLPGGNGGVDLRRAIRAAFNSGDRVVVVLASEFEAQQKRLDGLATEER